MTLPLERTSCILGPPGVGKTTRLLAEFGRELYPERPSGPGRDLVRPVGLGEIAFVTFGRKAVQDVRQRVHEDYGIPYKHLTWFRTIHSFARRVTADPRSVMDEEHWEAFAHEHGYNLSGIQQTAPEELLRYPRRTPDDHLRACVDWARNRLMPLQKAAQSFPGNFPRHCVKQFAQRLMAYKSTYELVDFCDMIEDALQPWTVPFVRVAFIDEAQDLSPLQIRAVEHWFATCARVYVAGDDDQAIYGFQGADPEWLIRLSKRCGSVTVLPQSYRVPASVHSLANQVIHQNKKRVPKTYAPRPAQGSVEVVGEAEALKGLTKADGSVLILARNGQFLRRWAKLLTQAGLPYSCATKGVVGVFSKPLVHEAVRRGSHLLRNRIVASSALPALFEWVSSNGPANLPVGIKAWATDAAKCFLGGGVVRWAALRDEHNLGQYLAQLEKVGPVNVLDLLPKKERETIKTVLALNQGTLPELRINLSTIHAAKGGEADTVVLVTGMSRASFEEYTQAGQTGREAENRVAYVGITRTRERLMIVHSRSRRRFRYPVGL